MGVASPGNRRELRPWDEEEWEEEVAEEEDGSMGK